MTKRISGTKEWADQNFNCLEGCEHNCRYCYARAMAMRFRRVKSESQWARPRIKHDKVERRMGKIAKKAVMFPTTHDITPGTLETCLTVLEHLLLGGNHVLVVSKPHRDCIETICNRFGDYKDRILFRFTIGAFDNDVLRYWDRDAPLFEERFASLKHAIHAGYGTSVSIEPMLDAKNVVKLFRKLKPYVTDAIWIGKMNRIRNCMTIRTKEDARRVAEIEAGQTDEKIRAIYAALKKEPKVKWKESIKAVVGLRLAAKPGLDV